MKIHSSRYRLQLYAIQTIIRYKILLRYTYYLLYITISFFYSGNGPVMSVITRKLLDNLYLTLCEQIESRNDTIKMPRFINDTYIFHIDVVSYIK
jgi:hypothetical protein